MSGIIAAPSLAGNDDAVVTRREACSTTASPRSPPVQGAGDTGGGSTATSRAARRRRCPAPDPGRPASNSSWYSRTRSRLTSTTSWWAGAAAAQVHQRVGDRHEPRPRVSAFSGGRPGDRCRSPVTVNGPTSSRTCSAIVRGGARVALAARHLDQAQLASRDLDLVRRTTCGRPRARPSVALEEHDDVALVDVVAEAPAIEVDLAPAPGSPPPRPRAARARRPLSDRPPREHPGRATLREHTRACERRGKGQCARRPRRARRLRAARAAPPRRGPRRPS